MDKAGFLAGATKKRQKAIQVPGLGPVVVRELSLGQRIEAERIADEDGISRSAALMVACTVDESGNAVFERTDAAALDQMTLADIGPLTTAVAEVNGLDGQAAEKNSSREG